MREVEKMPGWTAVIYMTGYHECCRPAVQSVLRSKQYFEQLIIVFPGYVNDEISMYREWKEDKQDLGMMIQFVPKLDVAHVTGTQVVELNPYCEARPGCFENLQSAIHQSTEKQTHLSVSSTLMLPNFSPFYGFLMISYFIDWFWNTLWQRNKMYQFTDVRVRAVMNNAGKRYLATSSRLWYVWNANCVPRMAGGDTTVTRCPKNRTGLEFVTWYLYTHTNYTWSWWIFPFSFFYIIISMQAIGILYGNWNSLYIIGMWLLEMLIATLLLNKNISGPYLKILVVLFPFYWFAFPIVLIYSKLQVPQRAWQ